MMQPSVHTTFSLWSGVFFLVFRMAECFSGNSNNCFVRVGEVGNSFKCIWIHLANDISCAVDIRIQNRTFLWFVLSTGDSFPWKMIFQTIPFFVDRNRIFVDQTCLGRIWFLCFNDRDTRPCCNTGQYPEKSCVWNTDKVLIVTGAKVDFLLLVILELFLASKIPAIFGMYPDLSS